MGPRQPLEDMRIAADDVVLDGLFGAGLSRPLAGEAAYAVEQVNASGAKVVAIDVPSGVVGDVGAVAGPAIRADVTVTFCCKKAAHVLQPATALCGDVIPAEIGFGRFVEAAGGGGCMRTGRRCGRALPVAGGGRAQAQARAAGGGDRADELDGRGATGGTGGAAGGCGAGDALCPPSALMVVAGSVMAPLMASFADVHELLALTETCSAVVIGPAAGVTEATRANVEALAKADRTLVLDADAITVFAGEAETLGGLLEAPAVLTPHMGEFERLFPGLMESRRARSRRRGRRRSRWALSCC